VHESLVLTDQPLLVPRSDTSWALERHTKGPWGRVTGRERVGENPVDLTFVPIDVLWLAVPQARPVSFLSVSGTFHVRVHLDPNDKCRWSRQSPSPRGRDPDLVSNHPTTERPPLQHGSCAV